MSENINTQEGDRILRDAIRNAQSIATIPILKLLKNVVGVDMSNKIGVDITKQPSDITISSKDGKKIKVYLDIVDGDYSITESFNSTGMHSVHINSFTELEGELKENIIELVSYMLKCALLTFNNLKKNDLQLEIIEYQLSMNENTLIYINVESSDDEDYDADTSHGGKFISVKFECI